MHVRDVVMAVEAAIVASLAAMSLAQASTCICPHDVSQCTECLRHGLDCRMECAVRETQHEDPDSQQCDQTCALGVSCDASSPYCDPNRLVAATHPVLRVCENYPNVFICCLNHPSLCSSCLGVPAPVPCTLNYGANPLTTAAFRALAGPDPNCTSCTIIGLSGPSPAFEQGASAPPPQLLSIRVSNVPLLTFA